MKTMKKFMAILLVIVMTAAMFCVTASASSGSNTYSITINGTSTGHTYEAYQIFSGSVSKNANNELVLSSIEWGFGIDSTKLNDLMTALKEINYDDGSGVQYPFASCTTAQTVADELTKYPNNGLVANAFAAAVGFYLANPSGNSGTTTDSTTYEIKNLAAGYYLVKDRSSSVPEAENETYTKYMITVVGDAEVTVKGTYPTIAKTVNTAKDTTFGEYVDVSIGDTVYFKLEGTTPENYSTDYSSYYYQFVDTMGKGLTVANYDGSDLNGSSLIVDAYVLHDADDSTSPISSEHYTATYEEKTDGTTTITVTFTDLKSMGITINNDDHIVVKYAAVMNSDAEIGNPGNINSAYLVYSNDPNGSTTTGKTPVDTAVVFTFGLNVEKIDSSSKDQLSGATFYLYKLDSNGSKLYAKVVDNKLAGWVEASSNEKTLLTAGTFQVIGLDVGTYHLEEVSAPEGYNKLTSAVKVYIAATYQTKSVGVSGLSVSVNDGAAAAGDAETGIVNVQVENKSGNTLPSTGGIGTTIFYVVGVCLIVGAAVLLIAKKRKNAED